MPLLFSLTNLSVLPGKRDVCRLRRKNPSVPSRGAHQLMWTHMGPHELMRRGFPTDSHRVGSERRNPLELL